jgi:hypothetical protein
MPDGAQAAADPAIQTGAVALPWDLRPATVVGGTSATSPLCTVTVDPDASPIPAISMVGSLAPGQRVMTLRVQPEGVYVAGFAGVAVNVPLYQRVIVDAAVATVEFTVPATLRKINVSWTARSTAAVPSTSVEVRFNNDATANYHHERIEASGGGAAGGIATGGATSWTAGVLAGGSATAGYFSSGHLEVPGWDMPHGTTLCFNFQAASAASGGVANSGGGMLVATGPWTSITLFPGTGSWEVGSDFQLEGWPA